MTNLFRQQALEQEAAMSPVMEVFLFMEKEKIQNRIKKRSNAALTCATPVYKRVDDVLNAMNVEKEGAAAAPAPAPAAEVIDMVTDSDACDSDDSMKTMVYPQQSPSIPRASVNRSRVADELSVPATVTSLWRKYKAKAILEDNERVDHGMCDSCTCRFSRGGLGRQLYSLMERLVQVEKALYEIPRS